VQQGETVRWQMQSPKDHRWYDVVSTPIRRAGWNYFQAVDGHRHHRAEAADEDAASLRRRMQQIQKLESLACWLAASPTISTNLLTAVLGNTSWRSRICPRLPIARTLGRDSHHRLPSRRFVPAALGLFGRAASVSEPIAPKRIVEEISRILRSRWRQRCACLPFFGRRCAHDLG